MDLISRINAKYNIPDALRERCRGKEIIIELRFHLFKSGSGSESRWQKDLDNLLKVPLDVLQKDADEHTLHKAGLGLLDNDKSIFGIYCCKDFVEVESEEGVEIVIHDAKLVRMKLERK